MELALSLMEGQTRLPKGRRDKKRLGPGDCVDYPEFYKSVADKTRGLRIWDSEWFLMEFCTDSGDLFCVF